VITSSGSTPVSLNACDIIKAVFTGWKPILEFSAWEWHCIDYQTQYGWAGL